MAKRKEMTVRLERQPNRRALERLRTAYGQLQQAGQRIEAEQSTKVREAEHETSCGPVWTGVDAAARTGSHD